MRLQVAIKDALALEELPGPSQVARLLGIAPAVVTNWSARGVSKNGALSAERQYGVSPDFVLTGAGSPGHQANESPGTEQDGTEPDATLLAPRSKARINQALHTISALLRTTHGPRRVAMNAALHAFIDSPGSVDELAQTLKALTT